MSAHPPDSEPRFNWGVFMVIVGSGAAIGMGVVNILSGKFESNPKRVIDGIEYVAIGLALLGLASR